VAALTLTLGLFVLFAGRTEHRVQSLASEDGRWCVFRSTLAAIADHWPYGAGLAAFPDVFPAYRDADCAGSSRLGPRHDFFLEGCSVSAPSSSWRGDRLCGARRGAGSRRAGAPRMRFLPVAGLAALVLVSLHGIVDFSLQIPAVAAYVSAAIAAAVAVAVVEPTKGRASSLENRAA